MNVIRCENGHFFDGDIYQVCPHCGASAGKAPMAAPEPAKPKKKGLFGNRGQKAQPQQAPMAPAPQPMNPPMQQPPYQGVPMQQPPYQGAPMQQNPYPGAPMQPQQAPFVPAPQQNVNEAYMDQPIYFDEPIEASYSPEMPVESNVKKKGVTLDFWEASSTESGFGEPEPQEVAEEIQEAPQSEPEYQPQPQIEPEYQAQPQFEPEYQAPIPPWNQAPMQQVPAVPQYQIPPVPQQYYDPAPMPPYQQPMAPQMQPPMGMPYAPQSMAQPIPDVMPEPQVQQPAPYVSQSPSMAPAMTPDIPKEPEVEEPVVEEPVEAVVEEPEESTPLREALKQASANSAGKTLSYFSAIADTSSDKSGKKKNIDPVVGWLVCTHGPHLGESFGLYSGANSIGRGDTNRVILGSDPTISRSKHAIITYEPKHRQFYIKPGESSGLTYLNEEYITETKKISEKDVIELGECKFIFIPLCGENFTWEEYINA